MPVSLAGSCRCGAVAFTVDSHTPYPYQLCYCSICRKTAGGGGFAINLMGVAASLRVGGREPPAIYRALLEEPDAGGRCRLQQSPAQRHFCAGCASALWLYDPRWPDLVHPFASAIDSDLPVPPARSHLMLGSRAKWVQPLIGPEDESFDGYPELSIEEWHRRHGLWRP